MNNPVPDGISVVVPVYNSEQSLPALYERLVPIMASLSPAFEVILVDDGSADASWSVVQSLSARHAPVRGMQMMRNYGQHNALLCGIRAASYSLIVTIDDDLQNPPEEIPRLVDKLNEGFDVVYGVPRKERQGLFRNFASRITKIVLQGAMGAETARNVSAFRAFRGELRRAFANYSGTYVSIDVLLTWGTRRFGSVRVRHDARAAGTSNYTIGKLIAHAMNMMTGYSTIPLQLASIGGFVLTGFGIAVLLYVLIRYILTPDVAPGFPFLASMIAIFSGAQLFALGIIGEYLARVHSRMMDRPSYTVRCTTEEKTWQTRTPAST